MKILICKITIGSLVFNWVNSVEVVSSWNMLTDTASIILPANIKVDKHQLSAQLKTGDNVLIEVGYDEDLNTIYKGYVTYVKPSVPIEISCEDEMWKLKQESINASGKTTDLQGFLDLFYPTLKTNILNINTGKYYYDNTTKAKVLDQLKSDFGLFSFFRDDVLVIGKRYDAETANHVRFKLDFNTIGDEDELEYKRKDQIKLKVKAISNNANGSKLEVEIGDTDGESRTLNFYDLTTSELKEHATREMERLRYDGWRGSFMAFGEPIVYHGDIVKLEHLEDSDKVGSYYTDKVVYTFGLDGFRQEITLGAKVL